MAVRRKKKQTRGKRAADRQLTGIIAARLLGFFSASPPFARGAVLPLKKVGRGVFPRG
jgi:hypothetical protein